MALTIAPVEHFVVGDRECRVVDVTFDSSYPIGGEAITASQLGFRNSVSLVLDAIARKPAATDLAVVVTHDHANGKLVAIWSDDNNAADSPLLEVADTTALTGYVVRLVAFGR